MASFGLESILVTGMCVDWTALENGQEDRVHPRGVQLRLGSKKDANMVDTLVMSNLGYFQLKANPGIWQLQLADGRSQEVYSIDSATGRSEFSSLKSLALRDSNGVRIPVASFSGENLLLLLRPNKGQIGKDVLDVASKSWTKQKDDRIHVFTVASGHMYERLQKIMILSATKRSSMRIKFWFIKNYMSPQMKQFVPVMARQYGFDYE
jgi:UDP-glucose:glycoprotein glucosyltransferase